MKMQLVISVPKTLRLNSIDRNAVSVAKINEIAMCFHQTK